MRAHLRGYARVGAMIGAMAASMTIFMLFTLIGVMSEEQAAPGMAEVSCAALFVLGCTMLGSSIFGMIGCMSVCQRFSR